MIIGVPREIKKYENRVSLIPAVVKLLVDQGHTVLVGNDAGLGSNFSNEEYLKCGATIIKTPEEIFAKAQMIVKVKEPQVQEYPLLRKGQILFTFLHLASSEELTRAIMKSGCIAIAYETIQLPDGSLPLLTPMSEIAGRMSVQIGAHYLQKEKGGRGILLGGVPGVRPATVVIIGAGSVGTQAAHMATGLGAKTFILDVNLERLRYISGFLPPNATTMMSNTHNIRTLTKEADLLISGVLLPGMKAPKLITREVVRTMKPGSVIIDVAIDQGGSLETSRPTDHENPSYLEEAVIHYCVTNIPSAVPATSTIALINATWPYIEKIANLGFKNAVQSSSPLAKGVNVVDGKITFPGIAETFNLPSTPLETNL